MDTLAPAQPLTLSDRIMSERTPLPSHALYTANIRGWISAVCQAEVDHADRDFWRVVNRMGVGLTFDSHDDPMCAARHRFPHEEKAGVALNVLSHLQTEERVIRDSAYMREGSAEDRAYLVKLHRRARELRRKFLTAAADYMQAREAVDRPPAGPVVAKVAA